MAAFKVGPDYIDPGYHALATGRAGRNLDPVLVGEQRIAPLAGYGAAGAQLAVVEGVMGLFDGRAYTAGYGSTAQVATLLGAPVLLVVDVRGQGRSLAALLHGFRSFDASVRIAGVVLNQVGSACHELFCRQACAEVGLPVLGALRRDAAVLQRLDGLDSQAIWRLNAGVYVPDVAVLLNAEYPVIAERLRARGAHSRFERPPGSSRAESDLYHQTVADLHAAGWPVMAFDCTIRRPETIAWTIAILVLHTYRERSQA